MDGNPHYQEILDGLDGLRDMLDAGEISAVEAMTMALTARSAMVMAWELHTQNLLACSQKVYLTDSPDEIRVRMGHRPMVPPEQSCPQRLMDGRNEIRCWLPAGHEGDHK